jgi:hypothetical protein
MPSWIDDEPGVRATLRQAARLLRGGLRRPVATVAISLLLVSTFVGKLALAPHIYSPKLVLRVVEMESDPLSASGPRHDMDGYVREVVWTDDVLLDLINRHNLYGGLIHDPRVALESFRRDIEVSVYQNYFLQERSSSDPPRSARIVVRFRSADPEQAVAVTRALGELIVDRELAGRLDQVVREKESIDADLVRARHAHSVLREDVALKRSEMASAPTANPRLQVELISILGSLESLDKRMRALERRDALLSLGVSLERQRLGLRFTVVDDGALALGNALPRARLAGIGLAALLLTLPLSGLAIGAVVMRPGSA